MRNEISSIDILIFNSLFDKIHCGFEYPKCCLGLLAYSELNVVPLPVNTAFIASRHRKAWQNGDIVEGVFEKYTNLIMSRLRENWKVNFLLIITKQLYVDEAVYFWNLTKATDAIIVSNVYLRGIYWTFNEMFLFQIHRSQSVSCMFNTMRNMNLVLSSLWNAIVFVQGPVIVC